MSTDVKAQALPLKTILVAQTEHWGERLSLKELNYYSFFHQLNKQKKLKRNFLSKIVGFAVFMLFVFCRQFQSNLSKVCVCIN